MHFRLLSVVLTHIQQSFAFGLEFLQKMSLQCFIDFLKVHNFPWESSQAENRLFSPAASHLQTKQKAMDKTLEQCILKEFKATCKNSCESELKQQKAT